MALILYPDAGYDSFVTVADADVYIETLTLQFASWDALDEPTKETYLRIACRTILDGIDLDVNPIPDPMPSCLPEAQSLIAAQDVAYNISADTATSETGAIKKQKVASLEVEYYDTATGGNSTVSIIPNMAKSCLESLGWAFSADISGLTQTTLGRS